MIRKVSGTVMWLAGILLLGYIADRDSFELIISGFSLSFGGYILLSRSFENSKMFWWLIAAAIAGRLFLFPSFPVLSDDIYRFYWDANLQIDDIPLLQSTPRVLLNSGDLPEGIYSEVFPYLNSKDYFTVYPTIIQWLNLIALKLGGGSLYGMIIILRVFHLIFDGLACWFLYRFSRKLRGIKGSMFWYLLNPLLIIECTANLHYEGIAIALLLGAFFLLSIHTLKSSLFFSASILVKLHPALLFPAIARFAGSESFTRFIIPSIILTVTGLIIGFGEELWNIKNSLGLYFQTFEFNAGPYYLVRELAYLFAGYNAIAIIGPVLSVLSGILILFFAFKVKRGDVNDLLNYSFLSYTVYLLLSTTLHPWYVLFPMALGLLTKWRTVVIAWSYLVIFSYSHYWDGHIEPRWPWVIAQYLFLTFAFAYSIRKGK